MILVYRGLHIKPIRGTPQLMVGLSHGEIEGLLENPIRTSLDKLPGRRGNLHEGCFALASAPADAEDVFSCSSSAGPRLLMTVDVKKILLQQASTIFRRLIGIATFTDCCGSVAAGYWRADGKTQDEINWLGQFGFLIRLNWLQRTGEHRDGAVILPN